MYLSSNLMGQTPTEAAYGAWEWSWNRQANPGTTIGVVSQVLGAITVGDYHVGVDINGKLGVARYSVAWLEQTGNGFIAPGTWYRLRLTRSNTGVFALYVLGGVHTSWTLAVSPTSNILTSSAGMVIDNDPGDLISLGSVDGQYGIRKLIAM